MKSHYRSKILIAIVAATLFFGLPVSRTRGSVEDSSELTAVDYSTALYRLNGEITSRPATLEESAAVALRDTHSLRTDSPVRTHQAGGLDIILRTTQQIDNYPQAKAVFERVAALWESKISTPMTVIVDIDFGVTCFGQTVSEDVLGMTNPQMLVAPLMYLRVLTNLLNYASTDKELGLYYALPQPVVTTDLGGTSSVVGPSSLFRALALIPRGAEEFEPPSYGPKPAIWFSSNQPLDFDPSDGISEGEYDFEGLVSREMGRVLGFMSAVGQRELNPACDLAPSVWDLFRVPLGTGIESFSTTERILSSGGIHFFFSGDDEFLLSTGRPDATGGDQRQASHWKDDSYTGIRIGIMDPTAPIGKRQTITLTDLMALDLFGYSLYPIGNTEPAITELAADLNGDVLTLAGVVDDVDGDVLQVQLKLFDRKDQTLGTTAPFRFDFGISPVNRFTLPLTGMSNHPAAVKASMTVTDSRGNTSELAVAEFTSGDEGGPAVSSASYKKGKLTIKGKRMAGDVQVEINGVVISPASGINNKSGKKLIIEGALTDLNLETGLNRVRVIANALRSNVLVAEF